MLKCTPRTQGGKGNKGMFIERDPKVLAAGMPTAQATETLADHLKFYQLQDEVDALIHDAIIPARAPKVQTLPKPPKHRDMRNAGIYNEGRDLINPTLKTKYQELVDELQSTVYSSYWKKEVGSIRDPLPMLPAGFNTKTKTMGHKSQNSESLYDLVLPKDPVSDVIPPSERPGYQNERDYCKSAFNPNYTFGIKYNPDKRGKYAKCCLTDNRVILGTSLSAPICSLEADFKKSHNSQLGKSKSPYDNVSCVPPGYAFGILKPPDNLPECLTTCSLNSGRNFFLKCLGHLNTLRKCLSKLFDANFFYNFYLRLKYLDKSETGWLPKQVVYDFCATKYIRFNPSLIEPLLEMWNAFDGSQIEYKTFVHVINYREPSPNMPKIEDVSSECIQFSTTYKDMVKPGQEANKSPMAGLPSGRYFDKDYPVTPAGYCKAHRTYLPEETDARACVNPSNLTLHGVSHRDMFAKRSPELIRKVFENAGEFFTDEKFYKILDEAKTYHSQGWVSFATFRKAFYKIDNID